MLQRSAFLLEQAPTIAEALSSDPPAPTADAEEFMYWSKERFGGKAVINATHVRIFRPTGIKGLEVLMTGTQIFATHSLDACLGVTALVRDTRTSRSYFVYLNRSDVDLLGGFWGGFARRIIERRVEADGPAILREVAQRLSSGDPPLGIPASHRPTTARCTAGGCSHRASALVRFDARQIDPREAFPIAAGSSAYPPRAAATERSSITVVRQGTSVAYRSTGRVIMSRVKTVLTMAGVVVAAAAAGCAVGLMVAPASGQELRRRLGWRVTDQWRSMSHSCERTLDRLADRAKRQIEERKRQVAEVIGT